MSCRAMGSTWQGLSAGDERRHRVRWGGFEIAAMVLGFVLFWPVGLAILFWILWSKRQGREVILPAWMPRIGPLAETSAASTGNSAFEEWRHAELDRLEEERRKLAAAQAEFQGFVDQLKRAKDREEFDRFMAARAKPGEA
jgi:hypothetical protein